jgi:hypothetical protein
VSVEATVPGWAGEDDPAATGGPGPPSPAELAADLAALAIAGLVELREDDGGEVRVEPRPP